MANPLGAALRERRQARGLSLGALALRAGIAASTLSRWESGAYRPGMVELEATLDALQVTERERTTLLALLDAPRAVEHLRRSGKEIPPVSGDLLKAMRLRQGWTQTQVAAQVGVSQATLAKWERSEAWPTAENLHLLCYTLKAREPEIVALTAGPMLPVPTLPPSPRSVEQLHAQFRLFCETSHDPEDASLQDLRLLTFEAQAWALAQQAEEARWLSQTIQAYYASYLTMYRRFSEADRRVKAILASPDSSPAGQSARCYAAISQAKRAVYGTGNPAPQRGIATLRAYITKEHPPEFTAWMLSDISEYMALLGDKQNALGLIDRAIRLAQRADSETEVRCRKRDRAKLLLQMGRPEEALPLLTYSEQQGPRWRITTGVIQAEALVMLGDNSAQNALVQVYSEIEKYHLERYRPQADAVRRRLENAPA